MIKWNCRQHDYLFVYEYWVIFGWKLLNCDKLNSRFSLPPAWPHYPTGERIFGESSLYNNLRLNAAAVSSNGPSNGHGLDVNSITAIPFQNGHFFAASHHHHHQSMGSHSGHNHLHQIAPSTQISSMFPDSTSTHLHSLQPHPEQILSYHYHHHQNASFR